MPARLGLPSPMEKAFVQEYVIDSHNGQAYRRAWAQLHNGNDPHNKNTWNENGRKLKIKPWVAKQIADRQETLAAKLGITQERVLGEMANLAFVNIQDYITVDANGQAQVDLKSLERTTAAGIAGLTTKTYFDKGKGETVTETVIKLAPKKEALDTLGRHVKLAGFGNKLEVTGEDGGPVKMENIQNLSDAQLEKLVIAFSGAEDRRKRKVRAR
jgi:phage terminase small subunit